MKFWMSGQDCARALGLQSKGQGAEQKRKQCRLEKPVKIGDSPHDVARALNSKPADRFARH